VWKVTPLRGAKPKGEDYPTHLLMSLSKLLRYNNLKVTTAMLAEKLKKPIITSQQ
jgi:hypothetical protein